ncbi:MAG: tetratricopeptide repeat protein, partial [Verrucomicrobiota bacterium]
LEGIRLLRLYVEQNPREQHAALRIAEIYEKDLGNYLAAALELEEILKSRLRPDRWGWTAIRLCNLYTGKLKQGDKAIALLRRLVEEHPTTQAAEKARKRLAMMEEAENGTIQEETSVT